MEELAIKGGKPYKTKPFPKWPMAGETEEKNLLEVLYSGNWWRITGSKVKEFEKQFAEYHGAKYCLGVTSGTHAIEILLSSMGIGAGDEVILPAFTFISTATAPIYCDAVPVLADVDSETFCMTPEAFEKAITPKTKAVIPVHMAGHMCDMDKICEIAKKHNIRVIEDAAHAHGAEWNGKKPGTLSDAAIFSFQNGKIMTSGEGGALITNDKEIYEKAFLIHAIGRPEVDKGYNHLQLGSTCRMNEFQAAILMGQLERLSAFNQLRTKNAVLLDSLMKEIEGITPQISRPEANINTHYMYMFYYNPESFGGLSRQDFVDALTAEGIKAFISYPVISDTEFFRTNNFRGRIPDLTGKYEFSFPNSERIASDVIWLHHHTLLGDEQDVREIAGAVRKIQDCMSMS